MPREWDEDEFNYHVTDGLQKLPLYFIDTKNLAMGKNLGESGLDVGVDPLMRNIEANIVQQGIRHVIIDNLQFMLGAINTQDKFQAQDHCVHLLRRLATEYGCHVTLVCHPRKEAGRLNLQSVFGSGKVTQEADNVVLLQRYENPDAERWEEFIEIPKNRHMGTVPGLRIGIEFEKKHLMIMETIEDEDDDDDDDE